VLRKYSLFALGSFVSMAAITGVHAADAPKGLSAQDFVREPVVDQVRFSPDGSRFAARAERQGQLVLVVVEFSTNKARVFNSDRGSDLSDFRWLTDDLIAVRTTKLGVRAFDLAARDFDPAYVSIDGKSRINPQTAEQVVGRVPGSTTEFIVERRTDREVGSVRWEVIDSRTGQTVRTLTGDPPGPQIFHWVLAPDLTPRAAWGYDNKSRKTQYWVRDSSSAPWRLLHQYDRGAERGFYPVAVEADGDILVLSNLATGRYALHVLDNATGKPGELVAGHPQADIRSNDLIYDSDRALVVGVRIRADKTEHHWFEQRRAEAQRAVDAQLPERLNALQFLRDGRVLVHSEGDVEPGAYYFYDPGARTLTEWARTRPWLRPGDLSRSEVFRYRARDGVEIPSYLTWPRGVPRDAAAPLLVWVHGGPASRDHWGFDALVQFFASRGYAVLQPNFRGSTGFGRDFERAGHKQWGLKMQDDVTDGVQALVKQGRIDAKRICIGGASYGGYAALMGVVREPDLFRCAIDMLGPTDLIWNVESPLADYNRRRGSYVDREVEDRLKAREGDPNDPNDRKMMEANSPRLLAAKIKSPVLLMYGSDDWRVPLEHGTAMRDALQAANATFEWKSYAGEGHGVYDRANQLDYMQRIERFLHQHIGASPP
jgi:dipeptidyl aminopeptidase/acylaminoacyl peptidase